MLDTGYSILDEKEEAILETGYEMLVSDFNGFRLTACRNDGMDGCIWH
jgi:hypothetical protein